jgi:creatinine amidohydrolase
LSSLPSYFYEKLTWEELKEAIKEQRVILLPVGSTEQHGYHLPMEVDNYLARQVSVGAAELVPNDVLVMPNIPYGFNTHHMDFPGQITINGRTFIEYCLSVTKSLVYHGFQKIIIVDGHGSNMPFLDIVARQTNIESKGTALCTALIHTSLAKDVAGKIRDSGRGGMGHACEWETSMYLHLNEGEVRKDKIVDEYDLPDSEFHWNELQDPSSILMMEWWTTFSKSGVSGSATLSSKEKGKILYDVTVERLARLVKEFKAREIRTRHDNHDEKPKLSLDNLLQF